MNPTDQLEVFSEVMNLKPRGQCLAHIKYLGNISYNYYSYYLNLHRIFSASPLSLLPHVSSLPKLIGYLTFPKKCLIALCHSMFLLLFCLPPGMLTSFLSVLILLAQHGHIFPLFQGPLYQLHPSGSLLKGEFTIPESTVYHALQEVSIFLVNYDMFNYGLVLCLIKISLPHSVQHITLQNVLKKYFLAIMKFRTQWLTAGVRCLGLSHNLLIVGSKAKCLTSSDRVLLCTMGIMLHRQV